MADEQFSVVWNSFPKNLSTGLYSLLTDELLVDVTIAVDGHILRAHKLVLSVCSTYFRDLFQKNNCKHPIVILKDINYKSMIAMLHFMYQGEVNIKQEDISNFLKIAETLQIKGLSNNQNIQQEVDKFTVEENSSNYSENQFNFEITSNNVKNFKSDNERNSSENINVSCNPIQNKINENDEEEEDEEDEDDDIKEEEEEQQQQQMHYEYEDQMESVEEVKENYEKSKNDDMFIQPSSNSPRNDANNLDIELKDESRSTGADNEYLSPKRLLKGRRTIKGINHSALPIDEKTLKVISELGPTLKMDRGKIVRMYSCPWCLRHFTRKENLKLHVKYIHGPMESLTCKQCGNNYKNSNSLRVHSYLYHSNKKRKNLN